MSILEIGLLQTAMAGSSQISADGPPWRKSQFCADFVTARQSHYHGFTCIICSSIWWYACIAFGCFGYVCTSFFNTTEVMKVFKTTSIRATLKHVEMGKGDEEWWLFLCLWLWLCLFWFCFWFFLFLAFSCYDGVSRVKNSSSESGSHLAIFTHKCATKPWIFVGGLSAILGFPWQSHGCQTDFVVTNQFPTYQPLVADFGGWSNTFQSKLTFFSDSEWRFLCPFSWSEFFFPSENGLQAVSSQLLTSNDAFMCRGTSYESLLIMTSPPWSTYYLVGFSVAIFVGQKSTFFCQNENETPHWRPENWRMNPWKMFAYLMQRNRVIFKTSPCCMLQI